MSDDNRKDLLRSSARSLCNDFANKEPLDTILNNFSSSHDHDILCLEHGMQHPSVPFLGRPFRGKKGAREYFELISSLLYYEDMKFDDYFIDVDMSAVSVRGEARFTWKGTGQSWDEVFTYRLRFDDECKVTRYEVWADSLAAYLAGTGQLLGDSIKK